MGNFHSYSINPNQEQSASDVAPVVPQTLANSGGSHSISINGSGSVATSFGTSSVDTGKDLSPFSQDDWRSTARTPYGTPTNEITEKTFVHIGGISAQVSTLVQAGVLVKQGEGFVLKGEESPNAPSEDGSQDQPKEPLKAAESDDTSMGDMPTEVVEAINSAMDGLPDFAVQKGGTLGIAFALGDASFDDIVTGIAQGSGMAPEETSQRVQFVMSAYQAQADNYITGSGGITSADIPDFYDFCRKSENKGALQDAIQKQVYGNSMTAWKPLIDKFMSGTAPSVATLRANGFETKSGPVGEELVRIQGVWMNSQAAARAGLI